MPIELIIGIGTNVIAVAVGYGVMKSKVDRLEKDLEKAQNEIDNSINVYVSLRHFDAVIGRLQSNQDEMSRDIKKILSYLQPNGPN